MRNFAEQFVSDAVFSQDEDLSDQQRIPFGFHVDHRAVGYCDWLSDPQTDHYDDYEPIADDVIIEAVEHTFAVAMVCKNQQKRAIEVVVKSRGTVPDKLYIIPDEDDGEDQEDDDLEVVEIHKKKNLHIRVPFSNPNRKAYLRAVWGESYTLIGHKFVPAQRKHSGNDTRRLKRGGKMIGNNHRRREEGEGRAILQTTHVRVDGWTFKVGRIA